MQFNGNNCPELILPGTTHEYPDRLDGGRPQEPAPSSIPDPSVNKIHDSSDKILFDPRSLPTPFPVNINHQNQVLTLCPSEDRQSMTFDNQQTPVVSLSTGNVGLRSPTGTESEFMVS
jgi:hypothetical protein